MMDAETRARKLHHQRELSAIKKAEHQEHLASRPAKVATGGGKRKGSPGGATERKQIGAIVRGEILDRQNWRCAGCDATLFGTAYDIDHIVPLELTGANHLGNLQALCAPCHKLKTRQDVRRISKAKRQSKLLQPREPSKHPIRSRGFS